MSERERDQQVTDPKKPLRLAKESIRSLKVRATVRTGRSGLDGSFDCTTETQSLHR